MSQIPPQKKFLPNYAWFDYVRPVDKDDIFNWRGKKVGTELKEVKRKEAPLQHLKQQPKEQNDDDKATQDEPVTDKETEAVQP